MTGVSLLGFASLWHRLRVAEDRCGGQSVLATSQCAVED